MSPQTLPPEIRTLPLQERLALLELIWNSIVDDDAEIELTEAQKAELDRRLALKGSSPTYSWDEVKQRILGE